MVPASPGRGKNQGAHPPILPGIGNFQASYEQLWIDSPLVKRSQTEAEGLAQCLRALATPPGAPHSIPSTLSFTLVPGDLAPSSGL